MLSTTKIYFRSIASILLVPVVMTTSGCATLFGHRVQTVRVITIPEGQTVYYERMEISDGESVTITKHLEAPRFNVGSQRRPVLVNVQYDPDVWLIADTLLLFFGGLPGVIALGVDFGSGAWRNLHDPQVVNVPEKRGPVQADSSHAVVAEEAALAPNSGGQ